MKNFDFRKFLSENKLTAASKISVIKEEATVFIDQKDLPQDVEWESEGSVAATGTENPFDLGDDEREEYDVEVFGYSPSTGKSYKGLAGGSYGEVDFDNIDVIEEIPTIKEKVHADNFDLENFFLKYKKFILTQFDTVFTDELLNNEQGGMDYVFVEYNSQYECYEIHYKYGGSDIFISDNPSDLEQFSDINPIDKIDVPSNGDKKSIYLVTTR